jgi:hypothetical protein
VITLNEYSTPARTLALSCSISSAMASRGMNGLSFVRSAAHRYMPTGPLCFLALDHLLVSAGARAVAATAAGTARRICGRGSSRFPLGELERNTLRWLGFGRGFPLWAQSAR